MSIFPGRYAAIFAIVFTVAVWHTAGAATLDVLREANWHELAARGREADGILGDYVLANDLVVAVVANHELRMGRSSGRSMLQAGGGVLDLVLRKNQNDLLTLFRLGADIGSVASDMVKGAAYYDPDYAAGFEPQEGKTVTLTLTGAPHYSYYCPSEIRYTLHDGEPFLRVEIEFFNTGKPWDADKKDPFWTVRRRAKIKNSIEAQLKAEKQNDVASIILGDEAPSRPGAGGADAAAPPRSAPAEAFMCQCPAQPLLRVAGAHVLQGSTVDGRLIWAYDPAFGQAYGVWRGDSPIQNTTIAPDRSYKIWCILVPGSDLFAVRKLVNELAGIEQHCLRVAAADGNGPRDGVLIRLESGRELYGAGLTDSNGVALIHAPSGLYRLVAAVPGLGEQAREVRLPDDAACEFALVANAMVSAEINGANGRPLPCKVAFHGVGNTPDADFFPESGTRLVRNLVYTPDGRFEVPLPPGNYRAIVTRGPEYDAETVELDLRPGGRALLRATLRRTVETPGWVSVDANTMSARSAVTPDYGQPVNTPEGRLLNLVAEQIEFAPTVECNTVTDDAPLVAKLGLGNWIATVPGIRLTDDGRKYAFNTQCAFPIEYREHQQDGGVPQRPQHCSQIDWLRSWGVPFPPDDPWQAVRNADNGYEKVIIVTQPDNRMAPEHVKNYELYSSMWRDADIAVDWRDQRAHFKPFLRDSDGDGVPDRISHHSAALAHAWDVRTLDPLIDPKYHVDNDILDWLETVRHGWRMAAIVGSTARDNFHGVGRFRSYVRCSTDEPGRIDCREIMREIKKGRIVMTTGPFVEMRVITDRAPDGVGVGDTTATGNTLVRLLVNVQAPNWITITELEILRNGVSDPTLKISRQDTPERFNAGSAQLAAAFDVRLERDTHFIAIARGSGPNLRRRASARDDTEGHVAITNPIYVDLGGDGFIPQSPLDDMVESSMRLVRPVMSREGAEPGRIEVTLTNHCDKIAADVLGLRFVPDGVLQVLGASTMDFTLGAQQRVVLGIEVGLTDKARLEALLAMDGGKKIAVTAWLLRSGKPPGVAPSRLCITVDGGADATRQIENNLLQEMFK